MSIATTAHTSAPAPVDRLVEGLVARAQAQSGGLSLAEVRAGFTEAGLSAADGKAVLRRLADVGVGVSVVPAEDAPTSSRRSAAGTASTRKGRTTAPKDASTPTRSRRAKSATTSADDPATEGAEAEETPAAALAPVPAAPSAGAAAAKKLAAATPVVQPAVQDDSDDDDEDADEETTASANDSDDDDKPVRRSEPERGVSADLVRAYLNEIGRTPLLNAALEVELSKRIEAGLFAEHRLNTDAPTDTDLLRDLQWIIQDGKRAKNHLLEANLRLVVSVAKKYTGRGMAFLDIIQEGNLGLVRAVEKFDYTKGYKFSTYAMWWIRQAITRAMADQSRTIRIPVHMVEQINKMARIQRELLKELGREPTIEELAEQLDTTPDKITEMQGYARDPISLDQTVGDDGDTQFGDFIEDVDAPVAVEAVTFGLMQEQLASVLNGLPEREAKVVALRYGLTDGRPRTLDEIGKEIGLTRERIRQIEKATMSKLRHPSRSQALRDYLE